MGVPSILKINEKDNVVIALQEMKKGKIISLEDGRNISLIDDIPASHKIVIESIAKGEPVYKYGEVIGYASEELVEGRWVHAHNLMGSETYQEDLKNRFEHAREEKGVK